MGDLREAGQTRVKGDKKQEKQSSKGSEGSYHVGRQAITQGVFLIQGNKRRESSDHGRRHEGEAGRRRKRLCR